MPSVPALRTLEQIEAAIDGALYTVNEALMEILDRKLYKDTHASFDLYCEQRWQITGRTARRRVEALRATLALGPGAEPVSQREAAKEPEPEPEDTKSRTRASENDRGPSPPAPKATTEGEQIAPSPEALPPPEYRAEDVPSVPTDQEVEDALFALLDATDPPAFYARLSDARKAHLRAWVRSLNPPAEAPRKPEKAVSSRPGPTSALRPPAPLDRREVVPIFKTPAKAKG